MSGSELLVIGLGNPGAGYAGTRHNVGAEAVGRLAARLRVRWGRFPGPAEVAEARLDEGRLILARSRTFMNESGVAGTRLVKHFGVPLGSVLVVYDDLNLPVARLRIRRSGSSGGHNGLKSLQAHWRSQDFPRVRIGIGRPAPGEDPIDYVLGRPGREERECLDQSLEVAGEAVMVVLQDGLDAAMTRFNRAPASAEAPGDPGEH